MNEPLSDVQDWLEEAELDAWEGVVLGIALAKHFPAYAEVLRAAGATSNLAERRLGAIRGQRLETPEPGTNPDLEASIAKVVADDQAIVPIADFDAAMLVDDVPLEYGT